MHVSSTTTILNHLISLFDRTDAAQSLGKVRVDVSELGVDLLTIVGHKFGAPKGIGALFVREGLTHEPLLSGGGQEHGRRAGTENVILIAALGEASRIALEEEKELTRHMIRMKRRLLDNIERCVRAYSNKVRISYRCNGPISDSSSDGLQQLEIATQHSIEPSSLLKQLPNTLSISFKDIKASIIINAKIFYDHVLMQ
jgi:cysteine sulfinate desulfinase/cysteine desulfurase-like protein